jgi:fructose-1,6-bisphosphatase/inositol monophosphatase family enzyme
VVVESEESGRQEIGSGTPRYRLVLDPVDGSDNWARGLPLSALSCAVLPVDAPVHPDWVKAALVGPLEQDTPLIAIKGCGAWRGKERLRTFGVRNVAGEMVACLKPPSYAKATEDYAGSVKASRYPLGS